MLSDLHGKGVMLGKFTSGSIYIMGHTATVSFHRFRQAYPFFVSYLQTV